MIRLPTVELEVDVGATLATWQKEVDELPSYEDRVKEAARLFATRNTRTNLTFGRIRASLANMCSGATRCAYCEDSLADEVEHFRPKQLYPEHVFVWPNYIYACGPCNGPKGGRFEVIVAGGDIVDVTRKPGQPLLPPTAGRPIVIDPRTEDPLTFLQLDLTDTFRFLPHSGLSPMDQQRAERTIAILGLNRRDALCVARREAMNDYLRHLEAYDRRKAEGAEPKDLDQRADRLKRRLHPTVWEEMKRQRNRYPALAELFARSPELLQA